MLESLVILLFLKMLLTWSSLGISMTSSLFELAKDVGTQNKLFESIVEMKGMVRRVMEVGMVKKEWWRTKKC